MANLASAPIEFAIDALKPYLTAAIREYEETRDMQARQDMHAYARAIGRLRNRLPGGTDDMRWMDELEYVNVEEEITFTTAKIARAQEEDRDETTLIARQRELFAKADRLILSFADVTAEPITPVPIQ